MIQRLRVPLGFVIAASCFISQRRPESSHSGRTSSCRCRRILRALWPPASSGRIRRLATSGPYAWTRNPLYFGSFLLSSGFAIMSANWIAAAAADHSVRCDLSQCDSKRRSSSRAALSRRISAAIAQSVPRFFPQFDDSNGRFPSNSTSRIANTTRHSDLPRHWRCSSVKWRLI